MGPLGKFLLAAYRLAKAGVKKDDILKFAQREFGQVTQLLRKQIDNIFKRKDLPETKKKGEVVKFQTEAEKDIADIQKSIDDLDAAEAEADAFSILDDRTRDIAKGDVEGGGIDTLETSVKKLKEAAEELKKTTIKPEGIMESIIKGQRVMRDSHRQGQVRTAVRWFMRQEADAGRLKLSADDLESLKLYGQTTESDPINIFRRYYGEDALEAADDVADVFEKGESFNHYAELLRKNVDPSILTPKKIGLGEYDASVVAGEKLRKAKEQEAKNLEILKKFKPDREPNAYGGIAGTLRLHRTGFKVGGIKKGIDLVAKYGPEFKKFADALLIKASNMIRQGKGMFKDLTEKQRIVQHDNLTKKVDTFQKEGTLEGMEQYFGINAEKAFVEAQAKIKLSPADEIRKEFPGITDDLVNNILTDDNPQRIAEVKATMNEALKMGEKGMGPDQIIDIFKKTPRTKNAEGGLISILKL